MSRMLGNEIRGILRCWEIWHGADSIPRGKLWHDNHVSDISVGSGLIRLSVWLLCGWRMGASEIWILYAAGCRRSGIGLAGLRKRRQRRDAGLAYHLSNLLGNSLPNGLLIWSNRDPSRVSVWPLGPDRASFHTVGCPIRLGVNVWRNGGAYRWGALRRLVGPMRLVGRPLVCWMLGSLVMLKFGGLASSTAAADGGRSGAGLLHQVRVRHVSPSGAQARPIL